MIVQFTSVGALETIVWNWLFYALLIGIPTVAYAVTKRLERRERLQRERVDVYTRFTVAHLRYASLPEGEPESDRSFFERTEAMQRITLISDSSVVQHLIQLQRAEKGGSLSERDYAFATLLASMTRSTSGFELDHSHIATLFGAHPS